MCGSLAIHVCISGISVLILSTVCILFPCSVSYEGHEQPLITSSASSRVTNYSCAGLIGLCQAGACVSYRLAGLANVLSCLHWEGEYY
jgi:hypothetical protein